MYYYVSSLNKNNKISLIYRSFWPILVPMYVFWPYGMFKYSILLCFD